MRKGVKIISIVGVCLLGSGIVLSMAALAFGASTSIVFREGSVAISEEGWGIQGIVQQARGSEFSEGIRHEVDTGVVALENFKGIDIEANKIDLEIVESSQAGIEMSYTSKEKISYEMRNNTLYIKQAKKIGTHSNKGIEGEMTIYIPTGVALEKVKIDVGMGSVALENIMAEQMQIALGMGEIECKDVMSGDVAIDMGMGEVCLKGTFEGNIAVNNGMGDISIDSTKPYRYYNYKLDKALGNVQINENTSSGMGTIHQNNDAQYTMDINCAMGDIEIQTAD